MQLKPVDNFLKKIRQKFIKINAKMKLNIIEEKENAFFMRKEIKAFVEAEISPQRLEVRKLLGEKFSVDPEAVHIKGIYGKFGSKKFNVGANIYKSEEEKNSVERMKKKDQKPVAPEEQPVAEEVKKEAPKEEAPVEEPNNPKVIPKGHKTRGPEEKKEEPKKE